jgi:hypothetical protein
MTTGSAGRSTRNRRRVHPAALTGPSHTDSRCGIPECRPGQSPARTPAAPSDPMLARADASTPPGTDLQPASPVGDATKNREK